MTEPMSPDLAALRADVEAKRKDLAHCLGPIAGPEDDAGKALDALLAAQDRLSRAEERLKVAEELDEVHKRGGSLWFDTAAALVRQLGATP